jgi:uncharacterized repeat protein (TIGR03803 family)
MRVKLLAFVWTFGCAVRAFGVPALIAALSLILAGPVTPQTFTILYSFTALASSTNSAGAWSDSDLIISGDTLYGTAHDGGSWGRGTVFAVNTDGTGFTNLHSFTAGSGTGSPYGTNSDGAGPSAGLLLSGNTLYGTTYAGGTSGWGTVFKVNTNGTDFTNLHSFTAKDYNTGANSDGAGPVAGLLLSGNTLYGTASHGGSTGNGTVFSLSFTPQLTIVPSAANVVLKWPTDYAGFSYAGYTLQSTTNLGSSAVWSTNSPAPVVLNGQSVVTNSITGSQQFFRLSH